MEAPRSNEGTVRAPAQQDRVVRVLSIAVLLAVIAVLAGIVYVLYAGLLGPRAPRTAVERQLQVLEQYTQQDPTSANAWADYLKALTMSGQTVKAQQVLDDIGDLADTEPAIMVEHGRLLIETDRDDEALDVLDEAIETARTQRDQELSELAGEGISQPVTDPYAAWIADASILKVGIFQRRDEWENAVEAATSALDEDPTMADVLVIRGYANLELGNEDAAREDFESALRLIPDYESALEGLDQLEGN